MDARRSSNRGKYLVIGLLAIAIIAALVGIWKRGMRPISPQAREAATRST
jgi:hypothetical protein